MLSILHKHFSLLLFSELGKELTKNVAEFLEKKINFKFTKILVSKRYYHTTNKLEGKTMFNH